MKVKLIVGYRRDQEHSIDANEAHKAYYLFLNPDARTIFSSGLAIKGDQIQEIVPDYHGTMGWNPTHVLDGDDWNEMHSKGIPRKLTQILAAAKEVASQLTPEDLARPFAGVLKEKYPHLLPRPSTDEKHDGMTSLKDLLLKRP